jgi:hypothetical protein
LLPPVGLVSRRGVRVKGKQDALDAYVLFALP